MGVAKVTFPGRARLTEAWDVLINLSLNGSRDLSYVVEEPDWIIKRIGCYIAEHLNGNGLLRARITTSARGIKDQIVHFGSINTFIKGIEDGVLESSNKIVITWFHIREGDDRYIRQLVGLRERVRVVHTAASQTKRALAEAGFPPEKIIVIPLGIETDVFKSAENTEKSKLRLSLGVPDDKYIIGSFQKDGNGWAAGSEPKLIKGPDIFLKTVKLINRERPVFVLLVGPARGYVENGLREAGVPFKSAGYLKNFQDIVPYYRALDVYLITSRIEGGPQQILEAWASRVPVVSTKVGMINDIARHEHNALLCEVEDVEGLAKAGLRVKEDGALGKRLVDNAVSGVNHFSWSNIAGRYYREIYAKL